MKHQRILFLVVLVGVFCALNFPLFAQVVFVGQSSEWEATGFNNGRAVVRDSSMAGLGYFHYVWHSQPNPYNAPTGSDCDIFYACTDEFGNIVIPPTNMTQYLPFKDNRYAAVAIENMWLEPGGYWLQFNKLHVVWQAILPCGGTYEVYYASIPVGNPPTAPVTPWGQVEIKNLSQTPETDSLVPAIAINVYNPVPETNQHLHVVWQEENITGIPGFGGADIAYTRSTDSGLTFMGPSGGAVIPWDNLTATTLNSQMPSISCALDTFYGFPLDYSGGDCKYASQQVHVSYNEDTPGGGINVYYLQSTNDGITWNPRQNITLASGGTSTTRDGYSNIAADMLDNVHIVFMRDVWQHDPSGVYTPGLSPANFNSWTGPEPGMYNMLNNDIIYWSNVPGYVPLPAMSPQEDREFPTVSLDREMNITVNWQELLLYPEFDGDYEVMRIYNMNTAAPSRPLNMPNYVSWSTVINDSNDMDHDDLFPNLAHKKVSIYQSTIPQVPFFTETWTKLPGHGPSTASTISPKDVVMNNNSSRDAAVN